MTWYSKKSDEELQKEQCLEKGDYEGIVIASERKKSQSGNWMIALEVQFYAPDGRIDVVRDWLIELPKFRKKIKDFCKSANLMAEYENEAFDANLCMDKKVKAHVIVKEYEGKLQNSISHYLERNEFVKSDFEQKQPNDDVPF